MMGGGGDGGRNLLFFLELLLVKTWKQRDAGVLLRSRKSGMDFIRSHARHSLWGGFRIT